MMTDPTANAAKPLPCRVCNRVIGPEQIAGMWRILCDCSNGSWSIDRARAIAQWNDGRKLQDGIRPQPAPQAHPNAAALASRILATIHNSNKMDHAAVTKVIAEWNGQHHTAPPEGEPDFVDMAGEAIGPWPNFDCTSLLADIAGKLSTAYRLGLAARPKVEDADWLKTTTLYAQWRDVTAKLAEREAELAKAFECIDEIAATPPDTPKGRGDDWQIGWQDGAMEAAAILRQADAARHQQKASDQKDKP